MSIKKRQVNKYKVYLTFDERYPGDKVIHQRFIGNIKTKDKLSGQQKIYYKIPIWDRLYQTKGKEIVLLNIIKVEKVLGNDIIVVKAIKGE